MARRDLLTPNRHDLLVEAVEAGVAYGAAAAAVGISQRTFETWRTRGWREQERLDGDPAAKPLPSERKYLRLVEDLEQVNAELEVQAVQQLRDHGSGIGGEWRALAFFLERRFPERWGPKQTIAHTGADGGPVETETRIQGSPELTRAAHDLMRAATRGRDAVE